MLIDTIKSQILMAKRCRNRTDQNVLQVVLGDIQTKESRDNKALRDDEIIKIINKTLEGVNDTLTYVPGDLTLLREKVVLENLLPVSISTEEVREILSREENIGQIRGSKNEGAAIGAAMKILKDQPKMVSGITVKLVVQEMRG